MEREEILQVDWQSYKVREYVFSLNLYLNLYELLKIKHCTGAYACFWAVVASEQLSLLVKLVYVEPRVCMSR